MPKLLTRIVAVLLTTCLALNASGSATWPAAHSPICTLTESPQPFASQALADRLFSSEHLIPGRVRELWLVHESLNKAARIVMRDGLEWLVDRVRYPIGWYRPALEPPADAGITALIYSDLPSNRPERVIEMAAFWQSAHMVFHALQKLQRPLSTSSATEWVLKILEDARERGYQHRRPTIGLDLHIPLWRPGVEQKDDRAWEEELQVAHLDDLTNYIEAIGDLESAIRFVLLNRDDMGVSERLWLEKEVEMWVRKNRKQLAIALPEATHSPFQLRVSKNERGDIFNRLDATDKPEEEFSKHVTDIVMSLAFRSIQPEDLDRLARLTASRISPFIGRDGKPSFQPADPVETPKTGGSPASLGPEIRWAAEASERAIHRWDRFRREPAAHVNLMFADSGIPSPAGGDPGKWERQYRWLQAEERRAADIVAATGVPFSTAADIVSFAKSHPDSTLESFREFLRASGRKPDILLSVLAAKIPELVMKPESPAANTDVAAAKPAERKTPRIPAYRSGLSPYSRMGFKPYLRSKGVRLTVSQTRKPDHKETRVIAELLREFALTQSKLVDDLDQTDYKSKPVLMADREFSLGGFFDDMEDINNTPFRTAFFIRVRFGLTPPFELRTLADFKLALDLDLFERNPWHFLSSNMQKLLIQELSNETGKPPLWLSPRDYETVRISALSRPERPFTLRNYYLDIERTQRAADVNSGLEANSREPAIFSRLKQLGLMAKNLKIQHPVETLKTPRDVKAALENEWLHVNAIPWHDMSENLKRQFVLELARSLPKPLVKLTAQDYEGESIPSLTFKDRSREKWAVTLRGLYRLYYDDPERNGIPTPAYILIKLGLADSSQVSTQPRRSRGHPQEALSPAASAAPKGIDVNKLFSAAFVGIGTGALTYLLAQWFGVSPASNWPVLPGVAMILFHAPNLSPLAMGVLNGVVAATSLLFMGAKIPEGELPAVSSASRAETASEIAADLQSAFQTASQEVGPYVKEILFYGGLAEDRYGIDDVIDNARKDLDLSIPLVDEDKRKDRAVFFEALRKALILRDSRYDKIHISLDDADRAHFIARDWAYLNPEQVVFAIRTDRVERIALGLHAAPPYKRPVASAAAPASYSLKADQFSALQPFQQRHAEAIARHRWHEAHQILVEEAPLEGFGYIQPIVIAIRETMLAQMNVAQIIDRVIDPLVSGYAHFLADYREWVWMNGKWEKTTAWHKKKLSELYAGMVKHATHVLFGHIWNAQFDDEKDLVPEIEAVLEKAELAARQSVYDFLSEHNRHSHLPAIMRRYGDVHSAA